LEMLLAEKSICNLDGGGASNFSHDWIEGRKDVSVCTTAGKDGGEGIRASAG